MSNRSLVELNHDYAAPADDAELLEWAKMLRTYVRSGDPACLPEGVTWLDTRHHSEGCAVQTLRNIRAKGWMVVTHNDYRLHGRRYTFWGFSHPETGRFVKGEGLTDAQALEEIWRKIAKL
jgi:hypothetical protein